MLSLCDYRKGNLPRILHGHITMGHLVYGLVDQGSLEGDRDDSLAGV